MLPERLFQPSLSRASTMLPELLFEPSFSRASTMLLELLFERFSSEFNFTAGISDAFFTIAEDEDPTSRGPHRPSTACSEHAHYAGFEGADSCLSAAITTLLPRVAQQERLLREGASYSLENIDVNEHNIEHDNNIEYYNLENDNNNHNFNDASGVI